MTAGPLLLDLSPELCGHVCVAISRHASDAKRNGMQVPPELVDLARVLAARAMRGQHGSPVDELWRVSQSEPVHRRLLTYEETAAALAVSVSTVKRLVSRGSLPAVHVSPGNARIRVTDLDRYISGLTEGEVAC